MIIIKCDLCGTEKKRFPRDVKNTKYNFCSKKCKYEWMKNNSNEQNQNLRFNHIDNNDIGKLYNQGLSGSEIAKRLGCSKELIYKRYKEIELKVRNISERKTLKLNENKVKELYLNGLTQQAIAGKFNRSRGVIKRILEKLNIKRKSSKHNKEILNINKIIYYYKKNKSTSQIAKLMCTTSTRIFNILTKNNFKLRDRNSSLKLAWKDNDKRIEKMKIKGIERFKDPTFLEKYKKSINRKPTTPERKMIKIIKKYNLPFNYVGNGKVWYNGFNPDFLSKNPKHIIEIYGDYWHNLPKDKEKHIRRMNAYTSLGYKPLVIWESELKNKNKVIRKIRRHLNE